MLDYREFARTAARNAGIDPDIFEQQIQQESGFNPNAFNAASGATGIAQIIREFHPTVEPTDPEASLIYAANWMKRLVENDDGKAPGAYPRALASYNWGPGNVSRWSGERGDLPAETQHYLDVILGAGWEHGGSGGGGTPPLGAEYTVAGVGGVGLRVRATPGLDGHQVGSLAEGDVVQAGSTVKQRDGLAWRQIMSPVAGWAASMYLTPTGSGASPGSAHDSGRADYKVTGVGDIGLRVRATPGLDGHQVGSLAEGDVIRAGSNLQHKDGHDWRQIFSPISGWVAATYLNPQGPVDVPHQIVEGINYFFPVQGYSGPVNLHWGVFEGGSDLFDARGTPVVAMCSGVVDGANFGAISGNYVSMTGDDGLDYWYAHGASFPSVSVGQRVAAGTFLFPLGDSGNAAGKGTHLHIGIGRGISEGADATGGCGKNFNAVGLLRTVLNR